MHHLELDLTDGELSALTVALADHRHQAEQQGRTKTPFAADLASVEDKIIASVKGRLLRETLREGR